MTGTVLGGFTGRAVAGLAAADVSWPASFVALAIMNAAVALALLAWLPSETRHVRPMPRTHPGAFGHLFRNRRLVATYGVGFCVLFTQVAMFTYVTFHVAAPPFNLSTAALGWLFIVYLVGAAVTPFAGRWIDVHGHRAGIASAMGIGATGVFIAQATSSSYIGAVTTQDRALAVGMYSTFYYAGGSTGAALPSFFWNAGGWPACVGLVVIVQAIGVAIALTQWSPAKGRYGEVMPEGL